MTADWVERPHADGHELLAAALTDWTAPDYVAVRALVALSADTYDRLARATAMGRQFVFDVRRRLDEGGADVLLRDAPSVTERIVETAAHQIAACGRSDLTMRTVSGEAHIPRRTLYNLYASSDALIRTCQRRAQTLWRARFAQRVVTASTDARERLAAVFDVLDAWVTSPRFRDDLALRAPPSFAADTRDDDLREHLAEVERFARGLADEARIAAPDAFAALVVTNVAGAAAWYDRRESARTAALATLDAIVNVR